MDAPAHPEAIDPTLLMTAYRAGIFPMADGRHEDDVFWVEPRMRAILPLDGFRLSHSLARTLRRDRFAVTCNAAFDAIIAACAEAADDRRETWISERIAASYTMLHELGRAHSIECWTAGQDGRPDLAGGLYGVGFDRVFCGESMFSRVSDASKTALAWLVAALRRSGAKLLDCQFMTPHLASLGAVEIPRDEYLARLREAQAVVGAGVSGLGVAGAGRGVGGSGGGDLRGDLPSGFAALLADAEAAGLASSPGKFIVQSLTQTS